MTKQELQKLSNQELLAQAKKLKSASFWSALVIGIMIGVIAWSIWKSTIGLFTLIPLYFIHKIVSNPQNKAHNEALKELLKERGLE